VQESVSELYPWLSGFPTDSFTILQNNCSDIDVHDDTVLSVLFLTYALKKAEKCIIDLNKNSTLRSKLQLRGKTEAE